jgi:predicted transcriptional regulator
MDDLTRMQDGPASLPESAEARQQRLAYEAARIDQALASAAAGRTVSLEAVEAWIDSLGTDHELPVPRSGR